MTEPVTLIREPLRCEWSAADAGRAVAGDRLPFALTGAWAGGGAIASSEPIEVVGPGDTGSDPFATLDRLPAVTGVDGVPEWVVGGGWFGWLGYRLAAAVETVPLSAARPVPMPERHLAYYDHVVRLDPDGRWWFEALVSAPRRGALQRRLAELRARMGSAPAPAPVGVVPETFRIDPADAARHLEAVAAARARIAAGEIFQANLCLRLDSRYDGDAASLSVTALRRIAPPYAAMFDTPAGSVVSLSPELFLRRRGERVVTAPIKGTIARRDDPDDDARALATLRGSAKDAAEHVMIVDLMRNDLGRVSEYGSVVAPRLPTAEAHPGLWHLVSHVEGRLRPGTGNAALLRATFPPGSVTGAPKVQALQVIAELESTGREVYTGAIGYASPLAGLELNVAIRTLELRDGRLWLGAGGGIVADSDPRTELDEAIAKAAPIVAAVGAAVEIAPTAEARACTRRTTVGV